MRACSRMGGTGGSLAAALLFSNWFFAGSVPIWIVNLLAALRGAGEVRLPATVTLVGRRWSFRSRRR